MNADERRHEVDGAGKIDFPCLREQINCPELVDKNTGTATPQHKVIAPEYVLIQVQFTRRNERE